MKVYAIVAIIVVALLAGWYLYENQGILNVPGSDSGVDIQAIIHFSDGTTKTAAELQQLWKAGSVMYNGVAIASIELKETATATLSGDYVKAEVDRTDMTYGFHLYDANGNLKNSQSTELAAGGPVAPVIWTQSQNPATLIDVTFTVGSVFGSTTTAGTYEIDLYQGGVAQSEGGSSHAIRYAGVKFDGSTGSWQYYANPPAVEVMVTLTSGGSIQLVVNINGSPHNGL